MSKIHATTDPTISQRELTHMNRVRKIATEGMVLLENNGVLPLPHIKNIAIYGNGARKTVKGGTGSGDVYTRTVTTVEQGLENANIIVTTKHLLNQYDHIHKEALTKYNTWVLEQASIQDTADFLIMFDNPFREPDFPLIQLKDVEQSETNTAIYVLSRNSGEGADRKNIESDYQLTEREKQNITFLSEHYKHFIVVLNVGGVIDTTFLREQSGIDAILLMSQAGQLGGDALVDILLGNASPCGKLTTTWAKHYEDYPSSKTFSHNNGNLDDEYYYEGIYVGYRYFDSFNITPAYCFGYGKSYTTFSIEPTDILVHNNEIHVHVSVTNTGNQYAGKEIVQLYISAPDGLLVKPYQQLCAFAKTKLLVPQESEELTLKFPLDHISSYREQDASWVLEQGIYYIRIGDSSRNTHIYASLEVTNETKLKQLKNICKCSETFKTFSSKSFTSYTYPQEEQEKNDAIHILLDLSQIETNNVVYTTSHPAFPPCSKNTILTIDDVRNGNATIEELVSQLSIEEMADVCVGTSRFGVKEQSIIGGASNFAPGAAGDTSALLFDSRNVRNMVLADGPAGVRLNRHFTATKDGKIVDFDIKDNSISSDPNIIDHYQYCTAIPIATHLAQTWNMSLLHDAGDIVGTEMEEFGITLWLAPGMNIHRNPLCGRNYEYYSEDPLLTGLCAGYETLGVQSHNGIGTTIKHFTGNNQEDNRYYVNDFITEQALREIYLKGFELCIKLSQPMAVMTSYNLINQVHTSDSFDLLTSVLRDEWNFKGLVMSDWGATGNLLPEPDNTKYTFSKTEACITSGNDLLMPGSEKDYNDIIEGVRSGTISLGDLQYCTRNILNVLTQTNCYDNAKSYSSKNITFD